METNLTTPKHRHAVSGTYFIATLFILAGLVTLAKNLFLIDEQVFHLFISWPALIIAIGLFTILRSHFIRGVLITAIGAYFLCSKMGLIPLPYSTQLIYWPIILITIGVAFILKAKRIGHCKHMKHREHSQFSTVDGAVQSENLFSSIHQAVTDETFKGGYIKNSCGATILDLRRTNLPEGNTYLDIDCRFGGIEIYAPAAWNIKVEIRPWMGGCEDNRIKGLTTEAGRTLVLRGNLSFSGIEIKN